MTRPALPPDTGASARTSPASRSVGDTVEAARMEPPGPLGAVLAGGESSRYGAPKALATVGGVRIVDRVIAALGQVTGEVVVSANEPALFADLGLPLLPDIRAGLGPLGGIYTALRRAREEGRPGIVALACDMPFPPVELLALLARSAFGIGRPGGAGPGPGPEPDSGPGPDPGSVPDPGPVPMPDVVVPASRGRRGIEPLCAAYSVRCIPAIDAALEVGDRRMIGFHDRVTLRTIPLAHVQGMCDPDRAFLNVNTPEDRERAESMVERNEGEG